MLLRSCLRWMVWLLGMAATGLAVERTVAIEAPQSTKAGEACRVVLIAGTTAGQGEQVGIFQADYSTDGGRTWAGLCYLDKLGPETRQERAITAGPAGSEIRVRLRVAFREGLAGDVDFRGAAIRWTGPWDKWQEPPAKSVRVAVK
ncbi:MAG: hypothetical protein QG602_3481 [Verrucomicrobiota bacterium]|nr:hypothetical protein [Verrucomicrobiota bacterium]